MTGKIKEYQFNTGMGVSSIQFIPTPTSGGNPAWGGITGTIGDQTDLANSLNAKAATATLSSAAYTLSTVYATSAQGTKADSAVQPGTLSSAAYTLATDYASSSKVYAYSSLTGLPTIPKAVSTVVATGIASSTSTSALPFTPLAFSVSPGTSYAFNFNVVFATAVSTTGIKIGLVYPSASTFAATVRIPVAADGVAGEFSGWITASGDTVIGTGVQTAATKYVAEVVGVINTVSTGTLQLTYGSEVAASAVSTFAGSYGILTTL